ncbi:IS66-like element accessory protein TnpA [Acidisoma cellulosilyticum]|nr:transposase [Acidisoma cellulosilyticum]
MLPRGEVCSSRRRRWSEEDKGRIVAESFEKGRTASDVARRHDISPQQLFEWRRQARSGELAVPVTDEMTFAEVSIGLGEPTGAAPDHGGLNLSVNGVTVRVTGQTNIGLVVRVVQALRSLPA